MQSTPPWLPETLIPFIQDVLPFLKKLNSSCSLPKTLDILTLEDKIKHSFALFLLPPKLPPLLVPTRKRPTLPFSFVLLNSSPFSNPPRQPTFSNHLTMFLMAFYSPKVYVVFPSSRVSVGCNHTCRGGPKVLEK